MIDAGTAKQKALIISQRNANKTLKKIERKIIKAVKNGKFSIKTNMEMDATVKSKLYNLGYQVENQIEDCGIGLIISHTIKWESGGEKA